MWNLEGQELKALTGHSYAVWSVAFSPDGKTLATRDGRRVIFLNLHLDDFTTKACHCLHDYLTNNPNAKPEDKKMCNIP